jgi:hypothetical protein
MPGTGSAEVEIYPAADRLPAEALTLLDTAPGIFMSRAWWDVVLSHALPPGAEALFVVIRLGALIAETARTNRAECWHGRDGMEHSCPGGRIVALLPLLRLAGRLTSLTAPYTCEYRPLLARGLSQRDCLTAMAAFARWCRRFGVVRLDALPESGDGLVGLRDGAAGAGLHVLSFRHFGNWHEHVKGLNWSAYLAQRPGALRETVRRRLRRASGIPDARFELLGRPADMARAEEVFEAVYRRSWKEAEPYPSFNVALMRVMSEQGLLRLGVWSIGADAVAAQFWVVKSGHATVLKLAHDEVYKAHSPGTVLTALMLRHLLDQEHVSQIDFGRGDDAYKQGWAGQRRQRIGLLLINPWTSSGLVALSRHVIGHARNALTGNRDGTWRWSPQSGEAAGEQQSD